MRVPSPAASTTAPRGRAAVTVAAPITSDAPRIAARSALDRRPTQDVRCARDETCLRLAVVVVVAGDRGCLTGCSDRCVQGEACPPARSAAAADRRRRPPRLGGDEPLVRRRPQVVPDARRLPLRRARPELPRRLRAGGDGRKLYEGDLRTPTRPLHDRRQAAARTLAALPPARLSEPPATVHRYWLGDGGGRHPARGSRYAPGIGGAVGIHGTDKPDAQRAGRRLDLGLHLAQPTPTSRSLPAGPGRDAGPDRGLTRFSSGWWTRRWRGSLRLRAALARHPPPLFPARVLMTRSLGGTPAIAASTTHRTARLRSRSGRRVSARHQVGGGCCRLGCVGRAFREHQAVAGTEGQLRSFGAEGDLAGDADDALVVVVVVRGVGRARGVGPLPDGEAFALQHGA